MGDKDFEATDHLSQGDGAVADPVADGIAVVDHDDKVILLTLVVDLVLGNVSARHIGCFEVGESASCGNGKCGL